MQAPPALRGEGDCMPPALLLSVAASEALEGPCLSLSQSANGCPVSCQWLYQSSSWWALHNFGSSNISPACICPQPATVYNWSFTIGRQAMVNFMKLEWVIGLNSPHLLAIINQIGRTFSSRHPTFCNFCSVFLVGGSWSKVCPAAVACLPKHSSWIA